MSDADSNHPEARIGPERLHSIDAGAALKRITALGVSPQCIEIELRATIRPNSDKGPTDLND